jgi:hypothetical protein
MHYAVEACEHEQVCPGLPGHGGNLIRLPYDIVTQIPEPSLVVRRDEWRLPVFGARAVGVHDPKAHASFTIRLRCVLQ